MHKTKKPFVDFRAIRAQVTMEQVLDHYGVLDTFKRNGNRLSGPCPIHGGSVTAQVIFDASGRNGWPSRARRSCSRTGRPCLRKVEI